MAEDNKREPQCRVYYIYIQPVPEKTELERLQERIANFKVQIPQVLHRLAQVLMNQSLQQPN